MTYSSEDLNHISKMISNSNNFEETLKLEKVFEDSNSIILLQMGYLRSGDFVLYESFISEAILTYEEYYFNWGVLLTIKKKTISSFNKKEYEISKSFDEIIHDFKKDTQKKYNNLEKNELLYSMEHQLKIHDNNVTFQSYIFELIMQSRNINFIKESFSL